MAAPEPPEPLPPIPRSSQPQCTVTQMTSTTVGFQASVNLIAGPGDACRVSVDGGAPDAIVVSLVAADGGVTAMPDPVRFVCSK